MTSLDVLSLQQAKDFLKVDFPDDDGLITTLIYAAVALIERNTQYRLYQRTEIEQSDGTYQVDLFQFPLRTISVTTQDGTPVTWPTIKHNPIRIEVRFNSNTGTKNYAIGDGLSNYPPVFTGPYASSLPLYNIVIDCGYTDVTLIPATLIEALKTQLSDWYENRIVGGEKMGTNVELMIAPFDRAPMF